MLALALCGLALSLTYWAGKRSLGQGLVMLFAWGYFYGIIRANIPAAFSHFVFDAALIGFYASQSWTSADPSEFKRLRVLRIWTAALIGPPILLALIPFQPPLVALVGLRGSVFFLPLLLLGARLKEKELLELSLGLAVLNFIAAGFAVAEYASGLESFYPLSPVTLIIYQSADVAGGFYRIPAIFTNAHAYGGAMVASTPFLLGAWSCAKTRKFRLVALCGIVSALFGILASATRFNFITGVVMILSAIATGRMRLRQRAGIAILIAVAAGAALNNDRFQRFKSLSDTDMITERVQGSVNRGFLEILSEYPMGNGMGGGGTSIPYFLEGQVRHPVATENEYTRILCEQGIIGLLLWIAFVLWYVSRGRGAFSKGNWATSRRTLFGLSAFVLCTAWIGNGLLTTIPNTALTMLAIGWTSVPLATSPTGKRRFALSGRAFTQTREELAQAL